MAAFQRKEDSESDSVPQTAKMSHDIDWLCCRASLCKVNLYNSEQLKGSKDRKLLCFVDVSSLNAREQDPDSKPSTSQSGDIDPPGGFDLEEKEVMVIKDENQTSFTSEGAVCFFKQSHCGKGKGNVVSWLSDDLQKYAIGFQHALTPSNIPPKSIHPDAATADKIPQHNTPPFNCSGA